MQISTGSKGLVLFTSIIFKTFLIFRLSTEFLKKVSKNIPIHDHQKLSYPLFTKLILDDCEELSL